TSLRRATYSVRPATLMWLGAGSPSAAAPNDGADIDELDRTAQSRKNGRIPPPRPVVEMATTKRRSRVDLLGAQRRVEIAQVILAQQGQGAGRLHLRSGESVGVKLRASMIRTLGRRAMRGPWPCSRERSRTVTSSP